MKSLFESLFTKHIHTVDFTNEIDTLIEDKILHINGVTIDFDKKFKFDNRAEVSYLCEFILPFILNVPENKKLVFNHINIYKAEDLPIGFTITNTDNPKVHFIGYKSKRGKWVIADKLYGAEWKSAKDVDIEKKIYRTIRRK